MGNNKSNRRAFLSKIAGISCLAAWPQLSISSPGNNIIAKKIPASGEVIPAIGMGTWISFNVGSNIQARNARTQVLDTFLKLGGGMVDSSPMYGSAEEVMGYALKRLGTPKPSLFAATKVWTPSAEQGKQQLEDSLKFWGVRRFDLYQIHNLLAWEKHLPILLQRKQAGTIRYVGVTTSHGRRHQELEHIIKTQPIDFVQLTYNMIDREAEQRLLPLAKEKAVAVIANRPFQGGDLFSRLADKRLPVWAKDIDCHNWAQFFLKFIVSHPAVTCAIPATSQVEHMIENMGALRGQLPDHKMRMQMLEYINTV